MKVKYFFPSVLLIIPFSIVLMFFPDKKFSGIPEIAMSAGFLITYVIMVLSTVNNRDVVIRLKNPMPFIIPVNIFISITVADFFIHKPSGMFFLFTRISLTAASVLLYAAAVLYLLFDLKKNMIFIKRPESGIKKKKLLLINPINKTLNKTRITVVPPMGLGIIAALTSDEYEVKIIDENFDDFKYEKADIVGITAFTADANRAYEIAGSYRAQNIPVIMGGVHATVRTEEALNYVDAVVTGEAEYVWKTVLKDFENGSLKKIYAGSPVEISDFVKPRRELFDYRYLFGTIQTSRGCPFNCSFCAVSTINGRKFRQRSADDVIEELKAIPQRHLFFTDDNILGYGKESEERAVEIFKGMVKNRIRKEWFCQSSINFGSNDEVLYWAAKSGCKMVYLGLESPDINELKGMNKFINTKLDYNAAFKNINRHGIAVIGAFIYGLEEETAESMNRKTDYILNNDIDVIETKVYTPLPGTEIYRQFNESNKLLYTNYPLDWDKYNLTRVTFKMKNMNEKEFTDNMAKCAKKMLSGRALMKKFFKTFIKTKRLSTAFWALNSNLKYVVTNQCLDDQKA